jgi:hypothetical protein
LLGDATSWRSGTDSHSLTCSMTMTSICSINHLCNPIHIHHRRAARSRRHTVPRHDPRSDRHGNSS